MRILIGIILAVAIGTYLYLSRESKFMHGCMEFRQVVNSTPICYPLADAYEQSLSIFAMQHGISIEQAQLKQCQILEINTKDPDTNSMWNQASIEQFCRKIVEQSQPGDGI